MLRLDQGNKAIYFSPSPTAFFALFSRDSSLLFELEEKVSPIFWVLLFSDWGCNVEATLSPVPLTWSPNCSVVVFWLSG